MKQMTLNVNNAQYEVFKAFIASLDYAKIVDEKSLQSNKWKKAILKSVETGLKEVELIRKGELKAILFKELLDKF